MTKRKYSKVIKTIKKAQKDFRDIILEELKDFVINAFDRDGLESINIDFGSCTIDKENFHFRGVFIENKYKEGWY